MFQLEKLISKNYFLNLSAKEAFKAYVRAYESHSLKNIFNVQTLDLKAVGRCETLLISISAEKICGKCFSLICRHSFIKKLSTKMYLNITDKIIRFNSFKNG
jgi:hypothetical protein